MVIIMIGVSNQYAMSNTDTECNEYISLKIGSHPFSDFSPIRKLI